MAADNKLLGQFDLLGLPAAPRGVPQIEVTFDIDANGIVSVSAKDKATKNEQQIRIQASGGLNEQDIKKLVKDAEANASEDKKKRALVEARNQAESLVHANEKMIKDNEGKISATDKDSIQKAIGSLKEVLSGTDIEAIKSRSESLAQLAMKMGEAMYRSQQQTSAPQGDNQGEGKTENEESLRKRLAKAEEELTFENKFDYILVNDVLEVALAEALQVVRQFTKS